MTAKLTTAQADMLDTIEHFGFVVIPHYALARRRTAESLRKRGLVTVRIVPDSGGDRRVTRAEAGS